MALRYLADRDRWEAAVSIRGNRIRRTFKKKADAQEFIRDVRLRKVGLSGVQKECSIPELFASYLEIDSRQKISASASADARAFEVMRYFFEKVRGLKSADEIGLEDLERFLIWGRDAHDCGNFSKRTWTDTTLARHAILLKTVLKKAVARGKLGKNPAEYWRIPGGDSARRRPMTPAEFEKLSEVAPTWFLAVIRFQRLTGARGASVAELRWSDVNFETATLYLRSRKGGRNREKRVVIPMYPALFNFLGKLKNPLPLDFPAEGLVFRDEAGSPLTAAQISRTGHRLIKKAGLEGVVLYGIRHALATELTAAGVPTEIVRQVLGHSDIRTTQEYAKGIASMDVSRAIEGIRPINSQEKTPQIAAANVIDITTKQKKVE